MSALDDLYNKVDENLTRKDFDPKPITLNNCMFDMFYYNSNNHSELITLIKFINTLTPEEFKLIDDELNIMAYSCFHYIKVGRKIFNAIKNNEIDVIINEAMVKEIIE